MAMHQSKFRLSSSAFERKDEQESEKILPKKMIILSVEGDETERTYFQQLNEHLSQSLVKIEVLRHRKGDGYSDPEYVIELLNEYITVREGELIPDELPDEFKRKYSKEVVEKYLSGSEGLNKIERKNIKEDLMLIGIDLDYRRYLQSFRQDTDFFGVILDRDSGNHSRELMERCKTQCDEKGYGYYISNPCFEFWLLLHHCDPKKEYDAPQLQAILENAKVSNRKTKVGEVLGQYVQHGKTISKRVFDECYYSKIGQAICNSKGFAVTFPELYEQLGTNLPELLEKIGYKIQ